MANQLIELQPDDPRVGKRDDKGTVIRWPEVDVFGAIFDTRVDMVLRNVEGGKGGLFVLISPRVESPELRVTLAGILKAQMVEPPVDEPPGKRSK